MNTFLSEFCKQIFTPAIAIVAITYLIRRYLDISFKNEFAHYKIHLQSEADKAIFEFQTKYSMLHQQRSEVIAELYGILAKTNRKTQELTRPIQFAGGPTVAEKKKDTMDTNNNLIEFFSVKRIYFSEELCKQIDDVLEVLRSSIVDFDIAHVHGMHNSENYKADATGLWIKSWKDLQEKMPPLLRNLESDFRNILLVKESAF